MILSLIGMSNAGKSYWAKRLETELGFERVCCDELIARRLREDLPRGAGEDVDALATWMGMPYDPGYREREAVYLAAEEAVLERVLATVSKRHNVAIDTTGSVVYLSVDVLERLRRVSMTVYLSIADAQLAEMTEMFFSHPKPLVWGQVFTLHAGETHDDALRRCYPELLRWRQDRYESLADVAIPFQRRHDPAYSTENFLHDVLQH